MKTIKKQNKDKSITIRFPEEIYNFISKKATENKVTKSLYLMHQMDKNSELSAYLNQIEGLLALEIQDLEKQMKENNEQMKAWLESLSDEFIESMARKEIEQNNLKGSVSKTLLAIAKKRKLSIH
jgi:hypothetical protein